MYAYRISGILRAGSSFLVLSVILCLLCTSCARDMTEMQTVSPDNRRFTLINYNVAGLPKLFGNQAEDVGANQEKIGAQLAMREFDIVAVQEDFGYHSDLLVGLGDAYPARTIHSGGVPGGDGLNVYSRFALYNETRTPWSAAYGIIEDGADEMTPKGILYTLIELEDGVYLDFYDIHADAYGDAGSTAAREVQFRQLADLLKSRTIDRPIIITGDFNTSLHHGNDSGLYENLMAECSLDDAWITLFNNGNTDDFSEHHDSAALWDSIEKVLFRSGGGVELTPASFAYEYLTDDDGVSLSDHPSVVCSFTYSLSETFTPTEEAMTVPGRNHLAGAMNKIRYIAVDLWKIFSNFDQLWGYMKPSVDAFFGKLQSLFS